MRQDGEVGNLLRVLEKQRGKIDVTKRVQPCINIQYALYLPRL